jgi:radical SAM superfamily enzyme YgiQ (UPF0313 family)
MRVLLVGMYPGETFGMAPLALKAAVRARPDLAAADVEVQFYQGQGPLGHDYDVAAIAGRVCERAPDVVGIGCYLWNREAALALAAELRRRLPTPALLVVGGPEVETREAAESVLAGGGFDVAVRGEGELTFAELLAWHLDGAPSGQAPRGISTWREGRTVHLPDAPPADPLDLLATPFDPRIGDFRDAWRIPSFETYRGCVMRCKFCNWGKARGLRFFGMERVRRDLDFILSLDIEEIWFVDAVFNLQGERYKEILRYLNERNTRGIRCNFEMMAELLDDEGLGLIAGFPAGSSVAFGLQSTDHDVVREASRPHNWRRFSQAIQSVRQRAPQVKVLIDLIYGMPGDRPEKFKKSLLDSVDLDPARIQVHPFRLLVGTRFHDERERYGFQDLGEGGSRISAQAGTPVEHVEEYRWYSYWSIIFHSLRHRSVIEDLHGKTSAPRSLLLESFMKEYERQIGRRYYQDLKPAEAKVLAGQMERIHSSLRAQFAT